MNNLGSTQCEATLGVSGAWKGSNMSKLYEELDSQSLADRRWARRLFQFYNIYNDISPPYFKRLIPKTFLYGDRREYVLEEIYCRASKYQNSFFPDTTKS